MNGFTKKVQLLSPFLAKWRLQKIGKFSLISAAFAFLAIEKKQENKETSQDSLPIEVAQITSAPQVPPPITRSHPARVIVNMETIIKKMPVDEVNNYEFWTFGGNVPGPFIRARVGDVLEVHHKNSHPSGMQHNIDFHCVTGPGGGAPLLTADTNMTKSASFKLLYPGLFFYHCSVDPIAHHVANGMHGLILVEPKEGLPPAKEFYVMQSEVYAKDDPENPKSRDLVLADEDLQNEKPRFVVFNGKARALVANPITATTQDRIRIYFGNSGPNLVSSFHVIGVIFDKVFREGGLMNSPTRGIHVTTVPAAGTTVVEFNCPVPGTFSMLDHSLSRVDKGAVGFLKVEGSEEPGIYHSDESPSPCPNCKIHP